MIIENKENGNSSTTTTTNPVELLIEGARKIQADADLSIGTVLSSTLQEELTPEFIDSQFGIAIAKYNSTIEIIENILLRDRTLNERLAEFLGYTVHTRNQIIHRKADMLEKLDNNKNGNRETLLTLNLATIYSWKESQGLQSIDKQIVGEGNLYLTKASDYLHLLEIHFNNSNNNNSNKNKDTTTTTTTNSKQDKVNSTKSYDSNSIDIDTDEKKVADLSFAIVKETPIYAAAPGNYIIHSNESYYAIILPHDIPYIYVNIFENQLGKISFFNVLESEYAFAEAISSVSPTATTTDELVEELNRQQVSLEKAIAEKDKEKEKVKEIPENASLAVKSFLYMSSSVESGGQTIASSIEAASNMISLSLRGGGYFIKSNLEKTETPTYVPPVIANSVGFVKSTTPYAAEFSSLFIEKISDAVGTVGNGIVSGVKMVMPKGSSDEETPTLDAAAELGKSSIGAISSISNALTSGLSQIAEEMSGTTVDIVNHKLGQNAAKVTQDTLSISKDVVNTALNLQLGSVKGVALKAITNGGVAVAEKQFNEEENNNNDNKEIVLKKKSD